MKKTNPIGIRMDPDVKDAIETLALEDGRSFSGYVSFLLRKHAEDRGALPKAKPSKPK
jgi:hypothetical protein